MIRGRKLTPHALRVLEGNPQRRPLPPPDPSKKELGTAVRSLNPPEQSIWRKVREECPWLKRADRFLVEAFARSWYQMVVADRKLIKLLQDGDDADPKTLTVTLQILDRARKACAQMMAEMGMTATSRARVLHKGSDEEEDPAAKYFTA